MPKSRILALSLLLALYSLPLAAAEKEMPITEIAVGMKGECRTVFRGTTIEPFGFEVLGLMKDMLGPKQDVILTRLTGEKAEFTGVVAGMSGSPCYINGRLVGALAYRFGVLTKEPIAGITPIANMTAIFKLPPDPSPSTHSYTPQTLEQALTKQNIFEGSQMQPIATPLSFAGFSPQVIAKYQQSLQNLGFVSVMGGGSLNNAGTQITQPPLPKTMEPGGAIAGQLVRGDLSIAGTGTVSYVDGNKVLGFGHPFFNAGYIKMPMATAYIVHILASELGSFKMAQAGQEVGAIVQDRLTAIYGEIGVKVPMIPIQVAIKDQSTVDPTLVNYEVFEHPFLTPLFMAMSINSSLQNRLNANQGGHLHLRGSIQLDNQNLALDNFLSVGEGEALADALAMQVANKLFMLWNNPFKKPQIKAVKLAVEILPQTKILQVNEVWADKKIAQPGDELDIHIRFKNYRQQDEIKTFKVKLPMTLPEGPLGLYLGGAETMNRLENGLKPSFESYEALVSHLKSNRSNQELYLRLITEEPGLAQHSQIYPKLPASLIELLDSSAKQYQTTPLIRSPGEELSFPMGHLISGQGYVQVYVSSQFFN